MTSEQKTLLVEDAVEIAILIATNKKFSTWAEMEPDSQNRRNKIIAAVVAFNGSEPRDWGEHNWMTATELYANLVLEVWCRGSFLSAKGLRTLALLSIEQTKG